MQKREYQDIYIKINNNIYYSTNIDNNYDIYDISDKDLQFIK
jgi:hypothetical protein